MIEIYSPTVGGSTIIIYLRIGYRHDRVDATAKAEATTPAEAVVIIYLAIIYCGSTAVGINASCSTGNTKTIYENSRYVLQEDNFSTRVADRCFI